MDGRSKVHLLNSVLTNNLFEENAENGQKFLGKLFSGYPFSVILIG